MTGTNSDSRPAYPRSWAVLNALLLSFTLELVRENLARDRTLAEAFSRWEWAANFLLFWFVGFLAVLLVFWAIRRFSARDHAPER